MSVSRGEKKPPRSSLGQGTNCLSLGHGAKRSDQDKHPCRLSYRQSSASGDGRYLLPYGYAQQVAEDIWIVKLVLHTRTGRVGKRGLGGLGIFLGRYESVNERYESVKCV